MSLKKNAVEEFRRSPIIVTLTVFGVTVALLSLLTAWLQNDSQTAISITSNPSVNPQPDLLNLKNLSILVSFFLGLTFSIASLISLTARLHDFAAFVLSIPAAVITSFSSLVILELVPPKTMSAVAHAAAVDSVLYGTITIFVAINGLRVLRGLFSGIRTSDSDESANLGSEGIAILFFSLLLLLIWSSLVSNGLSKLVTTFLTP